MVLTESYLSTLEGLLVGVKLLTFKYKEKYECPFCSFTQILFGVYLLKFKYKGLNDCVGHLHSDIFQCYLCFKGHAMRVITSLMITVKTSKG